MTAPVAPPRTVDQRLDALATANRIRGKRKKLKEDLKAGKTSVVKILLRPPAWALTMRAFDLLKATPKVGQVKADRIMLDCRISQSKTLGGLSERQRRCLVTQIQTRYPTVIA